MARLLEFPMPSMCCFNGTAIAGGYFLGLCHDFRTMHETVGLGVCLTEIKLGLALPYAYGKVLAAKVAPNSANLAAFAHSFT